MPSAGQEGSFHAAPNPVITANNLGGNPGRVRFRLMMSVKEPTDLTLRVRGMFAGEPAKPEPSLVQGKKALIDRSHDVMSLMRRPDHAHRDLD